MIPEEQADLADILDEEYGHPSGLAYSPAVLAAQAIIAKLRAKGWVLTKDKS